ncbi:MAG: recombinase family protein, partial [Gemmatimonadetes bacterium]|nr:recombinase family protein [Gemmatimonadota bacterium]
MTELKRRARLWLRVSNSDQQIENQRIALKSLCDQRGYKVDREYVAEGVSAWKGDQRALLGEALRDARAGRFDVLAVWALDRITREGPAEILRISEEFRKAGVGIVSLQEPWMEDEGDTRDLFISVAGWSARQESNRKSERNKAAHVRMVAEGKWCGG